LELCLARRLEWFKGLAAMQAVEEIEDLREPDRRRRRLAAVLAVNQHALCKGPLSVGFIFSGL
jgi:hypothetical protein